MTKSKRPKQTTTLFGAPATQDARAGTKRVWAASGPIDYADSGWSAAEWMLIRDAMRNFYVPRS